VAWCDVFASLIGLALGMLAATRAGWSIRS